jgi:hypothetical protein
MRTVRESVLGAVLTAFALAVPVGAQEGDEGSFQVFLEGRPVGTEEFTIRQTGSGANAEVVASGRVEVRLPAGTLTLAPRLRARGLEAAPAAYQVDVGGDSPRKIVGTVAPGRFSARIATPSGEQLSEFVASNGALILDEGVAHHYYFLAQRVKNGRVPVIVPRENRQVIATVTNRGEEPVRIGDRTVPLFHLVVQPAGGEERHVWVDALNRVIKVEIPARGYRAERTAIPR